MKFLKNGHGKSLKSHGISSQDLCRNHVGAFLLSIQCVSVLFTETNLHFIFSNGKLAFCVSIYRECAHGRQLRRQSGELRHDPVCSRDVCTSYGRRY